jgi:hypothetical protein
MRIEERRPCAACHNKRTVRWGNNVDYCFNCAHRRPRGTVQYPFSPAELRRLAIYRRAVQAGFYTDALPIEAVACA